MTDKVRCIQRLSSRCESSNNGVILGRVEAGAERAKPKRADV